MPPIFNLSFNYNPSNLSNEDAEKIVKQYTNDWKHNNDFDNVSFYVFNLTKEKADELKRELKMEDTYNIEIEKSQYADGGSVDETLTRSKIREIIAESGKMKIADVVAYFKSRYPKADMKIVREEAKEIIEEAKKFNKFEEGGNIDEKYFRIYANVKEGFDLYYLDNDEHFIGTFKTFKLADEKAKIDGYKPAPMWYRYAEGGEIQKVTNVQMFIEYINGDSALKLASKYELPIQEVEVMISYGREQYYNTEYYKKYLKQ